MFLVEGSERDMPERLLQTFLDAGYPPIGETLIEALPFEGYDPESYRLQGAEAADLLNHGDTVDLGNHVYTVLHLPVTTVHGGHDPGFDRQRMLEIITNYEGLWDAASSPSS